MIPNRNQHPKGQVLGVRDGGAAKWTGASSEDPYDTNVWGSTQEWDAAVSQVHTHAGDVVENAKAQVQINRGGGKAPRSANRNTDPRTRRRGQHGGWVSPAQFGTIPREDEGGGDITGTSGGDLGGGFGGDGGGSVGV